MPAYRFYGLRLQSDLPLRLLAPWNPDREREMAEFPAADDLTLTQAGVPQELEDVVWNTPFLSVARCGTVLVRVPAAGRFLVRAGREISVEPAPGVAPSEVETFLVGVVAGIVLHQRAVLPLHASCVSIAGKAIALTGPSGLGKSTLAGALMRRGATLLSDDICAVTFHPDGQPWAMDGALGLRLWPDSRGALGMEDDPWIPIRRDHPKLVSPVAASGQGPCRLAALIRLADGHYSEAVMERRYGPAAVAPLAELIYRIRLGRALGCAQGLFLGLMRLADAVPVFELKRPRNVERLSESVDSVLAVAGGSH